MAALLNADPFYAPPFFPLWDPVLIAARGAWQRVEDDRRTRDHSPADPPLSAPGGEVIGFGLALLVRLGQLVLSFYGFWLVWRVLLPVLPGPRDPGERIAPFAGYFLDPLTAPLVRLGLPAWVAALLLLIADAAALVAVARAG